MRTNLLPLAVAIATLVPAMASCDLTTTVTNKTVTGSAAQGDQQATRAPIINAFSANPTNTSAAGQAITFSVDATSPSGALLQFNWTATGGTLSTNTGKVVSWTPPSAAGTYTVQVSLSDGQGGLTTGSQNIIVASSGAAKVSQ